MKKRSLLGRFFGGLWTAISWLRLGLANLLFLLMLVLLYFVFTGGPRVEPPPRAALLLNPAGTVVDEKTRVRPLSLISEPTPTAGEVRLRDMIDAVDAAAGDSRISALVIHADYMVRMGLSKMQELLPALERFRATGKPIVAYGDYFSQDQYLLAAQAQTILMHPYGAVAVEGFSVYMNYFQAALEKLDVSMHVFHAGEYKSAAEPFLRNDMSPGEKEITQRWLAELWRQYVAQIEARRSIPAGSLVEHINGMAERLADVDGDAARLAVSDRLVDRLMQRNEVNAYLADVVGATDDEGNFAAVPFEPYIERYRRERPDREPRQRVAVVTAQGMILPGGHRPGAIGADDLSQLLSSTAAEPDVAAIVLRMSTGGGSVFASEVIRAAVADVRREGVPVIFSMGSAAASGGYFIATAADQIWATPATITGSIGVIASFPTLENLLQRGGVSTDGVGTTELAGALRLDRPLHPAVEAALSQSVNSIYSRFRALVAQSRGMTAEEVLAVAEGRVWSGEAALELGLVDGLGGLQEAVEAAADLAGLTGYRIDFVQQPMTPREMLLEQLSKRFGEVHAAVFPVNAGVLTAGLLEPVRQLQELGQMLVDPQHLYMVCYTCSR